MTPLIAFLLQKPRRNLIRFLRDLTAAALSLMLIGTAAAKIRPLSRSVSWKLPGRIGRVFFCDLDRDGRSDVLVFGHSSLEKGAEFVRRLWLCTAAADSPSVQSVDLRGATAFDRADMNSDGFTDLIFLCNDGVCILESRAGKLGEEQKTLIHAVPVFPGPDPMRMIRLPLAADFDLDGNPELVVPGPDGVGIYSKLDSLYSVKRTCGIAPRYRFEGDGPDLIVSPPRLTFSDFDGDSRPDLIHVSDARVRVFLNPSILNHCGRVLNPDLELDLQSRRLTHSSVDRAVPVSHEIRLADLNADGCVDLVLSRAARSGVISTVSQLHLYFNDRGELASFPDQILTAENVAGEYRITDMNRDGLKDLVLFNLDIGYTAAARFILTRKIVHRYETFLMRPDRTYDPEPDWRFTVKTDPRERPVISTLTASFTLDDFDGNGFPDLLAATDKDTWTVFPANSDGAFQENDRIEIQAPTGLAHAAADLNGDGASDLILWDRENPESVLRIWMSAPEAAP